MRELLRIAKRAVVLIEPIFELASPEAQQRMSHHGYVRDLKKTAENLGVEVSEYRLLDYISNPLNQVETWSSKKPRPGASGHPLALSDDT